MIFVLEIGDLHFFLVCENLSVDQFVLLRRERPEQLLETKK